MKASVARVNPNADARRRSGILLLLRLPAVDPGCKLSVESAKIIFPAAEAIRVQCLCLHDTVNSQQRAAQQVQITINMLTTNLCQAQQQFETVTVDERKKVHLLKVLQGNLVNAEVQ